MTNDNPEITSKKKRYLRRDAASIPEARVSQDYSVEDKIKFITYRVYLTRVRDRLCQIERIMLIMFKNDNAKANNQTRSKYKKGPISKIALM